MRASIPADTPTTARVLQSMSTIRDLEDLQLVVYQGVVERRMRAASVGGYAFDGDQVVVWDVSATMKCPSAGAPSLA